MRDQDFDSSRVNIGPTMNSLAGFVEFNRPPGINRREFGILSLLTIAGLAGCVPAAQVVINATRPPESTFLPSTTEIPQHPVIQKPTEIPAYKPNPEVVTTPTPDKLDEEKKQSRYAVLLKYFKTVNLGETVTSPDYPDYSLTITDPNQEVKIWKDDPSFWAHMDRFAAEQGITVDHDVNIEEPGGMVTYMTRKGADGGIEIGWVKTKEGAIWDRPDQIDITTYQVYDWISLPPGTHPKWQWESRETSEGPKPHPYFEAVDASDRALFRFNPNKHLSIATLEQEMEGFEPILPENIKSLLPADWDYKYDVNQGWLITSGDKSVVYFTVSPLEGILWKKEAFASIPGYPDWGTWNFNTIDPQAPSISYPEADGQLAREGDHYVIKTAEYSRVNLTLFELIQKDGVWQWQDHLGFPSVDLQGKYSGYINYGELSKIVIAGKRLRQIDISQYQNNEFQIPIDQRVPPSIVSKIPGKRFEVEAQYIGFVDHVILDRNNMPIGTVQLLAFSGQDNTDDGINNPKPFFALGGANVFGSAGVLGINFTTEIPSSLIAGENYNIAVVLDHNAANDGDPYSVAQEAKLPKDTTAQTVWPATWQFLDATYVQLNDALEGNLHVLSEVSTLLPFVTIK